MSPMMPLPPGGAPGTTADAATIAAFQQGYIAATMAAAAAAQQQGVAWTPPPPPPSINFPSSQPQQQPKDSLLPIPSGGSPAQFAGYYHQPHGMSFPAEGPTGVQQQQQQQQWGAALPSPQKGGRGGGGRHGNAQGVGRGSRGGSVQSHHQQGSSFPQAGWADPQLPSPQGTPRLQQHQQQPPLDLLRQQGRLLQQQQQQAQRSSQTGLDTISRGEPGSMKSSVAAQGGSDIQSASLAEGSTATPTVGGSTL
ncbi:conserved hypothetical protein [Perkinsus marinus ATCC 50983]|uniref:Uncharacterized protein n=1 Tax=Perkinsus marinus (strain ATCC 50983 / TXsc) TaxID=423536 RepID=C5K9P8_PERM5|nr:conserved hypothetical protein [Perkinsus marinus ATCC 50983]EER18820.1 conserved hypothetical protein [Perkinsus marinus ATCC 50983]|eukprot:XP_002787024.1 conserved hypothetical protein [Perkinsus marinus ATCC 50983]